MTVKDSAYHFGKLKDAMRSRITVVFRKWDPLTTWLEAIGKRAAEISADIVQSANDFYVDSAKFAKLDRRLGVNENVPRLLAKPATNGTITLGRQTAPTGPQTIAIGAVSVSPQADPSKPTAHRPTFVNTAAVTIDVGATSWTAAFRCTEGGTFANLPNGTTLQLVTAGSTFESAVVAAPFTDATDDELDDDYRQRGKLIIRSRAKGTDDALVAAALTAGAYFAFTVEDFSGMGAPVTLYAAALDGTLSGNLSNNIARYLNGDKTASPPIEPARAAGIQIAVAQADSVTFNFAIQMVVLSSVTGTLLTTLRTDIEAALKVYVRGLNRAGETDRTMRLNRAKDVIISFRGRGVVDVVDSTFLPAASTALTSHQMAVMGAVTWL